MAMLQNAPMYAYIPAHNVQRAREFYERKLGFKAEREQAGGVVYTCANGTSCFLYATPNAGTSRASQAFWQVADVDREIAELKSRGVVFEAYDDLPGERSPSGAVTDGGAKAAWFKDTEGNILALIQMV
jgi:catechol 2,3-dioxygenase-like lactoylglutathione lyase family enzyme